MGLSHGKKYIIESVRFNYVWNLFYIGDEMGEVHEIRKEFLGVTFKTDNLCRNFSYWITLLNSSAVLSHANISSLPLRAHFMIRLGGPPQRRPEMTTFVSATTLMAVAGCCEQSGRFPAVRVAPDPGFQ
jgi:hypothetical protein